MYNGSNESGKEVKPMSEYSKDTPEILSAKDIQNMGFSRSMSYALLTNMGLPVIQIGKRKFVKRDKFLEWLDKQEVNEEE